MIYAATIFLSSFLLFLAFPSLLLSAASATQAGWDARGADGTGLPVPRRHAAIAGAR